MATQKTCRVVSRNPEVEHTGFIEECFQGMKQYAAFYEIRYAAKPEGESRFKAPEPLTSEEAMRYPTPSPSSSSAAKASLMKRSSIQPPDYEGSADCLFLNVYTPKDPNQMNELLPVLVFIHGGGFSQGSSDPNRISPEGIVQFGVVFVTMNYRLGPFGFLCLRTEEITGNVGLKDQVQALKWIRDNINCFKGDPENVTISGWSAGATCVNLHMISPKSEGLFHKAILHSGGVFFPWGYRGNHLEQKNAFYADKECSKLIYDEEKAKEMCKHLHDVFLRDRRKRHPGGMSISPAFGPVKEKVEKDAFLADDIEIAMQKVQPKIPVMAGITRNEPLQTFINQKKIARLHYWVDNDKDFKQFLMANLRWTKETAAENLNEIRDEYFRDRKNLSTQEIFNCLLNFVHDFYVRRFYDCFKFGPDKTVHKQLYVYRFDHTSELSRVVARHKLTSYQCPSEATHGDDVDYMYSTNHIQTAYKKSIQEDARERSTEILDVMNHMWSLWANFCIHGVPKSEFDSNLEWKPHTKEKPYYLNISNNLVLKDDSLLDARGHWFNDLVNDQPAIESQKATPEDE